MYLLKAIRDADMMRPNKIPVVRKAEMLMALEGKFAEMMGVDAPALTCSTDDDTASVEDMELLMPYPKDECYCLYLAARIDNENQDSELYGNDYAVANAAVADACAWYRRTHKPISSGNWRVM